MIRALMSAFQRKPNAHLSGMLRVKLIEVGQRVVSGMFVTQSLLLLRDVAGAASETTKMLTLV